MGKGWIWEAPSLSLLLVVTLLSRTPLATHIEPQYLVLVPSVIHTETSENVCVQMNHLNETVTLSITMEYEGRNTSLIDDVVAEKDIFQCISFQLPRLNTSSSSSSSYSSSYLSPTDLSKVVIKVSMKGQHLHMMQQEIVTVRNPNDLLFVQTDKPIYKARQEVKFRVVNLDEDFRPVDKTIPLIYIQDPRRNRLFQWNNVDLNVGLTQLSFPLSSEPTLGTYKLVVEKSSGSTIEHKFDVEEYVLPKFEVLVTAPKQILIVATEFEVTICGRYTYGKPVPGLVKMNICRRYIQHHSQCPEEQLSVCDEYSGEADGHGCFSRVVKTKLFHLKQKGFYMKLEAEGKITEEGTGMEMTGVSTISITSTVSKLSFEKAERYYKPGIPLFLQMKLVDGSDVPIANETIKITGPSVNYTASYTTNEEGRIQFSIDTSNFIEGHISLQGVYKKTDWCHSNWVTADHQSASHSVYRFYSPSQSYLHIEPLPKTLSCGHTKPIRVHFSLHPDAVKNEITFYYLVMAKGDILRAGTHTQPMKQGKEAKGVFLLNLSVDADTAPLTRLLLYTILPSGELVAHSRDFAVEKCFSNKVRLWFSDPEGLPGEETQLHLAASPRSLCAIHAVDQSVFLLKPEAELSPDTVYKLLPGTNVQDYSYERHFGSERPCIDVKNIEDLGLKVFTSTKIHKPNICSRIQPYYGKHLIHQGLK
ncbi:alpha-2-macroglobulin-like [Liasis olivaceus]